MRSRSVLVVLSLLAFSAAPVGAAKKGRTPAKQQKKVSTKKQAGKKLRSDSTGSNALGATRGGGTGEQAPGAGTDKTPPEAVIARGAAVQRSRPVRRGTSRTVTPVQQHRPAEVSPVVASTTRPAFDTTRATATRRRPGRVKRWFVGMLVAVGLTAGAFGWQAADMNSKVSDAWDYIGTQISQVIDGNGGGSNGNPGPLPPDPIPDPGPSDPGPIPDPGPGEPDPSDPQQDPGQQQPGPSGGHGKQTPKGPETDRG